MTELILAVLVFLATHAIPAAKPIRAALVGRWGERAYLVAYSMLSLATLVWLGAAYARAPYLEIWPPAAWTRWLPLLVMPFACIFLVAALISPNPLSIGGRSRGFDAARPGIAAVTRHPLIWAFVLWAVAHIPANGDVASLILFGLLLALSLAGPPSLDAKRRASLGEERWRHLARVTSGFPFVAIISGRARLRLRDIGPWPIIGGLLLYVLLILLHAPLIGVSPLPI